MDVTANDFAQNRVTNPAQSEIIRNRLYDYQLYPLAGAGQLSFFQQSVGQGVTTALGAATGSVKTLFDTNMEIAGTLPSGKSFLIESVEVVFMPGSTAAANTYTQSALSIFNALATTTVGGQLNDVNIFYQSGLLELNVLSKNYLRETPLSAFPPKSVIEASTSIATNSASTGELFAGNARASGRPYYLEPKITLQPAVNFEVLLKWPAPVPMFSGFNGRVGVILDGLVMRASQ
jgi:hypothetical protein